MKIKIFMKGFEGLKLFLICDSIGTVRFFTEYEDDLRYDGILYELAFCD